MPELRRGARRGRGRLGNKRREPQLQAGAYVKTRAAVARERARQGKTELEEARKSPKRRKVNKRERVEAEKEAEEKCREEEKVECVDKGAMGDSGGLSANKAGGQEEEGNTAPFPEHVRFFLLLLLGL